MNEETIMSRIVLAISLCFLSGAALAATLKGAVFSPMAGVICDKKGGFCADYEGVSVALTKMYLGAKAEAHLMEQVSKGGKDFDATTFTMSDGIYCDAKAKQCKDKLSGKPDAAHTKALFGK
jgi:hypothetical protein